MHPRGMRGARGEGSGRANYCCPGLLSELSGTLFVLQMSLRVIVTTTPTPATTPCLSVLLTPHPLTRSVPRGDLLCGWDVPLGKASPLLVVPPQVPGSQLFVSSQAPERPSRAHGRENHATLPADWKHRREPHDRGRSLEAKVKGNVSSLTCCIILVGYGWEKSLLPEAAWEGHGSDLYLPFLRHQPPRPKL